MNNISDKLILALDVPNRKEAEILVQQIKPHFGWVKVGFQLFSAEGPEFVRDLSKEGVKIFLDLKFHDIPNTVARAVESVSGLGVNMMNLHALGGRAMMMEAAKALAETYSDSEDRPRLIAVTVLTSVDALTLEADLHIHHPLEDYVKMLAVQAEGSGLDGVVASAKEIIDIRSVCSDDFLVVTPGIRPAWASTDDQKRIKTPAEAIRDGASHLVIGRPVSKADDPGEAAARIVAELENDL